jgi:hypothetical protein
MKAILPLAALSAGIFASCAPSTPAARIAAQPGMFAGLPARHQELVQQGQIDKGMSPDAVYLAWGRASREYEGYEGKARTLRWDYNGSTPVYATNGYFGSFGWGYGRFGPNYGYGPYHYYGAGFGPEVTYVPYRRASVLFRNGSVASWERTR